MGVPPAFGPDVCMIRTTAGLQTASQVDMQLLVAAQLLQTAHPLRTEEVECSCDNHPYCDGKAMDESKYCATCEGERNCLNYPTCQKKPAVGAEYCESCLGHLDEQESCERCDSKVGLKETLCDPCKQNQCEKDNGMHWWSDSNSDSEMASGDV